MKKKVLFICVHNSARSQMAETFLKQRCGDQFDVHSAGLEPGKLNPIVVEAMDEVGIDISGNATKAVWDFVKSGQLFSYVITVCDEANAQRCPTFPGVTTRLRWSFPDPSSFSGNQAVNLGFDLKQSFHEACEAADSTSMKGTKHPRRKLCIKSVWTSMKKPSR